ncbi:exodeoxyribonuclease VII large subunit [Leptotrichia sp.]
MEQTILSVSELNREVKQYLESTQTFKNVFIKGELSNITYYSSGHLYFTLKDAKASVKCAIFKYRFRGVPTDLKEGDQVKIRGNASLYETNGSFQIIADFLEKTNTIGSLYEKMEMLKREYNEKGYFAESNKKKLPQMPMNIGVVTAETGAAIRDIINTTHKRFPNVNIYLYPSKVQGEGSAIEVSRGIEFFNRICDNGELDLDVLIVGRGGGSIEDLWAFNEEPVIEAIYKSKIPIVSAVGHEIDNLLSDLVADRRAATPTQAAEILIPEKEKLVENLVVKKNRLSKSLLNKIVLMKKELEQREKNYYIKNYLNILNDKKIDMIEKEQKLTKEIKSRIEKSRENLKLKKARLSKFSVEDILKQGYTITRKDGKIVKRGIELSREDKVEIQFADSVRKAIVK